MVEFNRDRIPLYKLIVHIAQIVLSVTIWCLEIVVFKGGDINGQMGWTFGVCFLSVPAWIYLIMAPRYPRASNIAQPNALLTVDAIFIIIWLSAFSTQAAYNTANHCGTACGSSKAIVGLGVFETLLWGLSTFISVATLQYYNTNGVLPGYDNVHRGRTHTMNNIDPDKAAFSTAPVDEEGVYAPLGGRNDHDHDDEELEFNAGPYGGHHAGGSMSSPYGGAGGAGDSSMPNDPDAFGQHHVDTSYGGAAAASAAGSMGSRYDHDGVGASAYEPHGHSTSPAGRLYTPPPAHDHTDYDAPAQFPAGNYDNIGFRQV